MQTIETTELASPAESKPLFSVSIAVEYYDCSECGSQQSVSVLLVDAHGNKKKLSFDSHFGTGNFDYYEEHWLAKQICEMLGVHLNIVYEGDTDA